MGVKRLEYRHICAGHKYDPSLFSKAVEEAIKVFKGLPRGDREDYKFTLNDTHPLTIADLKEINSYIDKIWADEEIYIED